MPGNGVELVWDGKRRDVERVPLPFQRVEIINESRASRQADPLFRGGRELPPDRLFAAAGSAETPWRNKLIWGDNKYVLASLIEGDPSIGLESLAGKVDLIYIDPPFATGQDFSFRVMVGDEQITKEPTAIEETAYRDTWGRGPESYLQMLYERLVLIRELLTSRGTVYVHLDDVMVSYVKCALDEVFGSERFVNQVVWRRTGSNTSPQRFGRNCDFILVYSKSEDWNWNSLRGAYDGGVRRESLLAHGKRRQALPTCIYDGRRRKQERLRLERRPPTTRTALGILQRQDG
jgi:adenine specific DNA methylase Mod